MPDDNTGKELKHPIQPLYLDEAGTLRFKRNEIVRHLVKGNVLNDIACMDFPKEDHEQLAQLECRNKKLAMPICVNRWVL